MKREGERANGWVEQWLGARRAGNSSRGISHGCVTGGLPTVVTVSGPRNVRKCAMGVGEEQTLGTNPSVPGQNIANTLQGNGQFTYHIPTQYIANKFRIFPVNFFAVF
jgi:hypothetical protein